MADALEAAGYKTINDVDRETEIDRFAIKTGLGSSRATEVKDGVTVFLRDEWPAIEVAQAKALAAARAAAEAEAAEARAKADAEAAAQAAAAQAEGDASPADDSNSSGAEV
ncbi:MAG: hypothetical protein KC417_16545 [Myxococcales bacterium]|nr:hypothetical protein [Myxococcales bacterium]